MRCKLFIEFEKGVEAIKEALNSDYTKFSKSIADYGQIAFLIYQQLIRGGNEPKMPVRVATNRFEQSGCHPVQVAFWREYDVIILLYEFLKQEGYYAGA